MEEVDWIGEEFEELVEEETFVGDLVENISWSSFRLSKLIFCMFLAICARIWHLQSNDTDIFEEKTGLDSFDVKYFSCNLSRLLASSSLIFWE